MAKTKNTATTNGIAVEAIKHQDKRANIPTSEMSDFLEDEAKEVKKVRYPRDESLDPQLFWKGKDEQNERDLEVPAVPIYIQEKISPQVIIEGLREAAKVEKDEPQQLSLFGDFDGLEFEQMVEFYQHEQNWSNRMILGDSLLVMNSLAEKENLKGKVQMIYFDPPYGIRFGSNWQVSTRKRSVADGKSEDATRQPEQIKAFRDTWELGIHSYLPYLRDRLLVARTLLTESGSVFVQIGEENVHLVRCILDEVFGNGNFCGQIAFVKTSGLGSTLLADRFDTLLWYAYDIEQVKYRQLFLEKSFEEGTASNYSWLDFGSDIRRGMTRTEKEVPNSVPNEARIYKADNITSQGNPLLPFVYRNKEYKQTWKTNLAGMERLAKANRLHIAANSLQYVRYLDDFKCVPITKLWDDTATGSFTDDKIYVVQTGTKTIARCILMTTDPGDLVLDPTCGSGTTAYVSEQWGRRWITIDTSRVALALARTRLMTGRFPYYLLSDSVEGVKKEVEMAGLPSPMITSYAGDIKKGFVYKRVPHITLKAIANNPEIDAIYEKYAHPIEVHLGGMNEALKKSWEEWQVPQQAEAGWSQVAKDHHEKFRLNRQWRQKEIDEAIARNAETELLYDQPYEDGKRVRVTGPFTVESLSPHRVIAADVEQPASVQEGQKASGQFETRIIEALKKSGVQNTIKGERLKFDSLEPYAGTWLQATGDYTENEKTKRVAVSIGPEYGTVGKDAIKDSAKEAIRGVGFDLLLVCAFAFDPDVQEEMKQYGKLTVLPVRMNADLLIVGDEKEKNLLKSTGTGNLFMVFGEPDVSIDKQPSGQVVVRIRGLDIYDPTTGEIRSNSTDDIACWFIDTNYNGESFFVCHAYFTGADQPYEKLKRALKAEIDEGAWAALYSTVSRPFDKPSTGKIAVKVINHYGDEVLKVYSV